MVCSLNDSETTVPLDDWEMNKHAALLNNIKRRYMCNLTVRINGLLLVLSHDSTFIIIIKNDWHRFAKGNNRLNKWQYEYLQNVRIVARLTISTRPVNSVASCQSYPPCTQHTALSIFPRTHQLSQRFSSLQASEPWTGAYEFSKHNKHKVHSKILLPPPSIAHERRKRVSRAWDICLSHIKPSISLAVRTVRCYRSGHTISAVLDRATAQPVSETRRECQQIWATLV